jgi:hypothetical protein
MKLMSTYTMNLCSQDIILEAIKFHDSAIHSKNTKATLNEKCNAVQMSLINLNTVTMNVFSNKFLAKKALE